jgi:Fur family transcriptional regulator, ferric uptake regulator
MAEDLQATVAARLRRTGQRYTLNRRALVDILAASGRPVSIPEILVSRHRLAQSSAYRNLTVLEQARVVRRVEGGDEFARYELAEDLTGHHHHLVCSSCGAVQDFTAPTRLERTVDRVMADVAASTGFTSKAHSLRLVGLCRSCA